jgi:hypothetical protein
MNRLNRRPEFKAAQIERARVLGKRTGPENLTKYNKSATHRAVASRVGKETIKIAVEACRRRDVSVAAIVAEAGRQVRPSTGSVAAALRCSDSLVARRLGDHVLRSVLAYNGRSAVGLSKARIDKSDVLARLARGEKPKDIAKKLGCSWVRVYQIRKQYHNHTVVSVTEGDAQDVYDISVPGVENFAVDAGIFVHNSKDVADAVCGATFNAMIDLRAAGAEVANADPVDNINSRFRTSRGEIGWDSLERDAR